MSGVDRAFEVGVILRRGVDGPGGFESGGQPPEDGDGRDGYDEAMGGIGRWWSAGRDKLAGLGEDAVRLASGAVAAQVAMVAEQVASRLEQSTITQGPGQLALDTVELTFGVMLTAGTGSAINAFVTAEGESSFEVTITLSRRSG